MYTHIIDNTRTTTLMPIIRRKIEPDGIVFTDNYRSCNALIFQNSNNIGLIIHRCFAEGHNHINGNKEPRGKTKENYKINLRQPQLKDSMGHRSNGKLPTSMDDESPDRLKSLAVRSAKQQGNQSRLLTYHRNVSLKD